MCWGACHRPGGFWVSSRDSGATANVAVPERLCLPADGVYVGTYVDAAAVEHRAAISLGRRPTFYEESGMLLLEAHLLDFEGDLYGQDARVRFQGTNGLTQAIRMAQSPIVSGVEASGVPPRGRPV